MVADEEEEKQGTGAAAIETSGASGRGGPDGGDSSQHQGGGPSGEGGNDQGQTEDAKELASDLKVDDLMAQLSALNQKS